MSVRQLDAPPALSRLYLKAAVSARGRRGDRLPDLSVEQANVAIDRDHLVSYDEVCGFRKSDVLPPTYPHVLAFPLAVTLMIDPAFPFALPGLIHIANRISQRRLLSADERLTLSVRAADLRPHPRGTQFDMTTEATAAGEPVWVETSTYLHKSRSPSRGSAEGRGGALTPTALWRVPASTGRRYAAVSGDVNPIHLNPLAARLFGFRRAIAHGMWLKARCLAALEGRLGDGLNASVEFRSPLLLPSTVAFAARPDESGGWTFAVWHPGSGRPHLNGHVESNVDPPRA